ncbi:MAG: response regulator transcription factor [Lachnospiraceae bacterium]
MRILIVEDEYSLADMIGESLEKEKYIADIALDGEEGFYKFSAEIYDLIILDVMLPKMNGYELLKTIRETNHEVPVLMLTAKSELEEKIFGLDAGADDYMTKPFAIKELLARVRALMRRSMKMPEATPAYADLKLVPTQVKLCCTSSGQEITLGSKEYLLMEYLILNASHILSKEQISNKVWGYETSLEYNNTEVYISFLRKKLQFLQSKVCIRTVRGTGYCLEESECAK